MPACTGPRRVWLPGGAVFNLLGERLPACPHLRWGIVEPLALYAEARARLCGAGPAYWWLFCRARLARPDLPLAVSRRPSKNPPVTWRITRPKERLL
jgi:hypothetical protein